MSSSNPIKDPVQRRIVTGSVAVHLFFLLMLLFYTPAPRQKKEHKPLIVRTVSERPVTRALGAEKKTGALTGKPKSVAPQSPPVHTKTAAQKPKESKAVPLPVKKPTPAKKVEPQKKVVLQSTAKISDSLLKELEESIAKIEHKSDKTTISKKGSPLPVALQIDRTVEGESGEGDYVATLISHLHEQLKLPDHGEVKIQLSLRQDGTVAKLIVLKAENNKNRLYLESHLLELRFPRFEGALANKGEHSFVLTFCNEN